MKNSIKLFFAGILFLCSTNVFAQGVDIVTLTTTAEGKTQDEAVTSALRSAIEQAFGTFISSKTEIVNDDLIKDEIVSVSSGNIQKYDILSSTILPNENTVVVIKADVSVTKLTSFAESKGVTAEFKGAAFAANIKLQQLYKENELKAIKNLQTMINEALSTTICYDYTIKVSEPRVYNDNWELEHQITVTPNENHGKLLEFIKNTLAELCLYTIDQRDYFEKRIDFYNISFHFSDQRLNFEYYFRNKLSIDVILDIYTAIDAIGFRFQVKNGIYTKYNYSRILQYEGKKQWCVGLLTNHIPTYCYPEFDCKNCLFSEWFSARTRYVFSLKSSKYYDGCKYETYNKHKEKYDFYTPKYYSWGEKNYHFNSSRKIKYVSYSMGYQKSIIYTEILPLSVLEKIQQFTVEPYTHKDHAGISTTNNDDAKAPIFYFVSDYFSEGLMPAYNKTNKYGFIDKTGKEVISFIFSHAYNFSEGMAAVEKGGKWGFIDTTGNEIIPCIFDKPNRYGDYYFSEGLACVKKGGKWGFIDKTGNEITSFIYEDNYMANRKKGTVSSYFSEGLACVKKDEKWGFIDKTGKEIIPHIYRYARNFSEGLALVSEDSKSYFIDETGKKIISVNSAESFSEGMAHVMEGGKWGFIDKNGKKIVPCIYEKDVNNKDSHFSEGLAIVKNENDKFGFIDKNGKEIIPFIFSNAFNFSDGLALVCKNGKYGFIDKTGNEIIPFIYNWSHSFADGLARVQENEKWIFIDKTGAKIIPF